MSCDRFDFQYIYLTSRLDEILNKYYAKIIFTYRYENVFPILNSYFMIRGWEKHDDVNDAKVFVHDVYEARIYQTKTSFGYCCHVDFHYRNNIELISGKVLELNLY